MQMVQYQSYPNFNPRAHEGHDSRVCAELDGIRDFNPRAHEGHDRGWSVMATTLYISIHVPTRGTTNGTEKEFSIIGISIHVPTRGTTLPLYPEIPDSDFNPRAHEGHDFGAVDYSEECAISIHVPTRGTTLKNIYV